MASPFSIKLSVHKIPNYAEKNFNQMMNTWVWKSCPRHRIVCPFLFLYIYLKHRSKRNKYAWRAKSDRVDAEGAAVDFIGKPVAERMEKKIDNMEARYLSLGGRTILIQSALKNLPIYFTSLFRCLMSVINQLERL